MKINRCEFGHMKNMAAMPLYGKIIKKKNLPLQNQWPDGLETWYVILGSWGPLLFIQMMTGLTLTFGCICFCMGKS